MCCVLPMMLVVFVFLVFPRSSLVFCMLLFLGLFVSFFVVSVVLVFYIYWFLVSLEFVSCCLLLLFCFCFLFLGCFVFPMFPCVVSFCWCSWRFSFVSFLGFFLICACSCCCYCCCFSLFSDFYFCC